MEQLESLRASRQRQHHRARRNRHGGKRDEGPPTLILTSTTSPSSFLSPKAAGYEYINLDDGWAVGRDNHSGVLLADPHLFPKGIKAVADFVHSKGLKFGLYTARGSRTCLKRPGSDSHEELDAQTFAVHEP